MAGSRLTAIKDRFSITARILAGICLIVFLLSGIQVWMIHRWGTKQEQQLHEKALKGRDLLLKEAERIASNNLALARVIASMESVKEAVGLQDRERLLGIVKPIVEAVDRDTKIPIKVHFHIPPGKSFLRVWKPDKYGDDLRSFRNTVVETLSTGRSVEGIEAGRVGLAVRGVAPIFWGDKKPVGSVEVATDLTALAKLLHELKGDVNEILSIQSVETTAATSRLGRLGKFTVISPPPDRSYQREITEGFLDRTIRSRTAERRLGDTLITATVIPDYKGQPAGIYIKFIDLSRIHQAIKKNEFSASMVAVVALVLAILVSFIGLNATLKKPLSKVLSTLDEISQGHFNHWMRPEGAPEIKGLARMSNNIIYSTGQLLNALKAQAKGMLVISAHLKDTTDVVKNGAKDIDKSAEDVASASGEAAETLETVAKSTSELTEATNEIAQSVAETAKVTDEAREKAQVTQGVIQQLGDNSEKIGGIIQVISTIAEQTNLLALNATIEAARAGEAGKGFSVVANEVKELAKQTAQATGDITDMIHTIQAGTKEAVSSVEEINSIVARINDLANTIASAAEEQTATVSEIDSNVGNGAQKVRQLEVRAREMAEQANEFAMVAETVNTAQNAVSEIANQVHSISKMYHVDRDVLVQAKEAVSPKIQLIGAILAHYKWIESLRRALLTGNEPDVETDPSKCFLGEWLIAQSNYCSSGQRLFEQIGPMHEDIHHSVEEIHRLMKAGNKKEDALDIFTGKIEPVFNEMIGMLTKATKIECDEG